jgi:hypothetical protein
MYLPALVFIVRILYSTGLSESTGIFNKIQVWAMKKPKLQVLGLVVFSVVCFVGPILLCDE